MVNNVVKIIKIAEIIAPIISSRDAVDLAQNKINQFDNTSIELDFSAVEFISRSVAHALLVMKEDFLRQSPKKEIILVNTNQSITNMLRIVSANRIVPKNTPLSINIPEISINSWWSRSQT